MFVHVRHAVTLANDDLAPVVLQRRVLRKSSPLDSGNMREPVLQLAVHRIQLRLRVGRKGRGQADRDPMVRLIAEVLVLQLLKAVRQQARTGEQHHRECRLHNHQDLLRDRGPVPRAAVGAAQCLRRLGTRGEPRGCRSEEHSRDQRQRERKRQHRQRWRSIDRHILRSVEGERDDRLDAQICHHQAGGSTKHGQHNALGQRLPDQSFAIRAQRQPHRRLRPARRAARQQQVRDVGAGNQQHQQQTASRICRLSA